MDEAKPNDGLKYIGDGSVLVGLPPRDLTAEEIAASEYSLKDILDSGLYVKQESKKAYTPKPIKAALKGDVAE